MTNAIVALRATWTSLPQETRGNTDHIPSVRVERSDWTEWTTPRATFRVDGGALTVFGEGGVWLETFAAGTWRKITAYGTDGYAQFGVNAAGERTDYNAD